MRIRLAALALEFQKPREQTSGLDAIVNLIHVLCDIHVHAVPKKPKESVS